MRARLNYSYVIERSLQALAAIIVAVVVMVAAVIVVVARVQFICCCNCISDLTAINDCNCNNHLRLLSNRHE